MLSEMSQSQRDTRSDFTYMRYLEQSDSQGEDVGCWFPGAGGGGHGALGVGTRLQLGAMKKVEMDGGGGRTQCACADCHRTKVKRVNFTLCVFLHTL